MATLFTDEVISSPAEFAQGSLVELDALHAAHYVKSGGRGPLMAAVCAPNVDVLVTEHVPDSIGLPDEHYQVPIFGDLYPITKDRFEADGKTYNTYTYLSAAATNEMLEDIGLRPGEDVARFKLIKTGNFTLKLIHDLMKAGEHGVSTDPIFMDHDRRTFHGPGVLTMHPKIFANAKQAATSTIPESNEGREVASDFHDTTFLLTTLVNRVYRDRTSAQSEVFRSPVFSLRSPLGRFLPLGRLPLVKHAMLGSLQAENFDRLEELVSAYKARTGRA